MELHSIFKFFDSTISQLAIVQAILYAKAEEEWGEENSSYNNNLSIEVYRSSYIIYCLK